MGSEITRMAFGLYLVGLTGGGFFMARPEAGTRQLGVYMLLFAILCGLIYAVVGGLPRIVNVWGVALGLVSGIVCYAIANFGIRLAASGGRVSDVRTGGTV
jgi:hypothetical protein